FFFSSRRRHTRSYGDWSSDVCSSDLVLQEDARDAQAFVDRWGPRVEAMTNARHRGMLRVVLGETLEQKRFFEQALAGRTDLLGRSEERRVGKECRAGGSRWRRNERSR